MVPLAAQIAVALPTQSMSALVGICRAESGVEEIWRGYMSANLGAMMLPDGTLWVGMGRTDNVLRVWGPAG